MNFTECLTGRRSVRKYKADAIDHAVIEKVVAAASYSPSWKNSQTVRYILVEDKALLNKIADECVMDFEFNKNTIKNAPALMLVTTVTKRSGYERDGSFSTSLEGHWESFDAGIATQSLCLAAHSEGLGTVIMGIYDNEKTVAAVGVPEGQMVSAMVAIGYPDEEPAMPKRKTVEDLLSYK